MALVPTYELGRAREGLRRLLAGLTPGQKLATGVAAAAVVLGGALLAKSASSPTYAPLFTGLQPSDASAIVKQLGTDKVPYQLADGGATVLVPSNLVDSERVALAGDGLPAAGNVGLSQLDKAGITTSQLAQQAEYDQALQGQLEQTIDSIHGVSSSQVNLAVPSQDPFAIGPAQPTGASVMVELAPGQSLSSGEVQAIVHLVASSVPGVNADQVTVADSSGDLLAGPGVSTSASSQGGQTAAYEGAVERKVSSLLASVLGPGNAAVSVNAVLNFDKITTTTHGLQTGPGGRPLSAPSSSNTSKETLTGTSGAAAGGVLGSTTAPPVSSSGPVNYNNSSTSTQYETGTVDETDQVAPGGVTHESVAVLVNSRALPAGVKLASLRSEVAAAAGIVPKRGDVLALQAAPFSTAAARAASKQAAAAASAARMKSLVGDARSAGLVLAVLVVLLLIRRAAKRQRLAGAAAPQLQSLAQQLQAVAPPTVELPAVPTASVDLDRHALGTGVKELIDNQPDEVANLLRGWMAEPGGTRAGQ